MIRVYTEEYCQKFEPAVNKRDCYCRGNIRHETDVYCKYRERCAEMVNYLRREVTKR